MKLIGNYHFFPFQDVKKDSEVIVYGAGEVGKHYIQQILYTGYCSVNYATDRNWKNIKNISVKMISPEEAAKKNVTIVIANGNANAAKIIKEKLISLGVSENSIIWNDKIISEEMVVGEITDYKYGLVKRVGWYHVFPFSSIKKGEKIIIWGMGEVGKHYCKQLEFTRYVELICAVDSNWTNIKNNIVNVFSPDYVQKYNNVKIVIANGNYSIYEKIKQQLHVLGVKDENIIWNDIIITETMVVNKNVSTSNNKNNIDAKSTTSVIEEPIVNNDRITRRNNGNVKITMPSYKLERTLEILLQSGRDIEIICTDDILSGGIEYAKESIYSKRGWTNYIDCIAELDDLLYREISVCMYGIGEIGRKVKTYIDTNYPTLRVKVIFKSEEAVSGEKLGKTCVLKYDKRWVLDNIPIIICATPEERNKILNYINDGSPKKIVVMGKNLCDYIIKNF